MLCAPAHPPLPHAAPRLRMSQSSTPILTILDHRRANSSCSAFRCASLDFSSALIGAVSMKSRQKPGRGVSLPCGPSAPLYGSSTANITRSGPSMSRTWRSMRWLNRVFAPKTLSLPCHAATGLSSGSRASLPRPGPLRTGHDDCSSSGSSLRCLASAGSPVDPTLYPFHSSFRRGPIYFGPRCLPLLAGLFGSHRLTSPAIPNDPRLPNR